jgi:hypothetical protein
MHLFNHRVRADYAGAMALTYQWRGEFENGEVNALHAEAWWLQVQNHSLGWVCKLDGDRYYHRYGFHCHTSSRDGRGNYHLTG